jgi:hypothetical protein
MGGALCERRENAAGLRGAAAREAAHLAGGRALLARR